MKLKLSFLFVALFVTGCCSCPHDHTITVARENYNSNLHDVVVHFGGSPGIGTFAPPVVQLNSNHAQAYNNPIPHVLNQAAPQMHSGFQPLLTVPVRMSHYQNGQLVSTTTMPAMSILAKAPLVPYSPLLASMISTETANSEGVQQGSQDLPTTTQPPQITDSKSNESTTPPKGFGETIIQTYNIGSFQGLKLVSNNDITHQNNGVNNSPASNAVDLVVNNYRGLGGRKNENGGAGRDSIQQNNGLNGSPGGTVKDLTINNKR